jgi:diguanylate cyclase (GGDEF)-like protein
MEVAAEAFQSRATGESWAVIMMDLDGFKLLNDVFGHSAGDTALRQLGGVIRRHIRSGDIAVRYGGDEMVVIMPDTRSPGALDLCNRLRDEIRRNRLHETLELTVSAGIACSREGELRLDALVERADRALLAAKDSGKDRVFFYSSEMESSTRPEIGFRHFVGRRAELRRLRSLLRESLERGLRISLLSGEEGLGKTRLIAELEHYAEFRGVTVLYSPSVGAAGAHPYSIALGPVVRALELLEPEELVELCRRVEPLHPALLELLPGLQASPRSDSGFFGQEGARYRLFEDLAGVLRELAAKTRLMLVYEDMQMMPETDLDLLVYCCRTLTGSRMMMVFTCDGSEAGEVSAGRILELAPEPPVERVRLERLSRRDTFSLILFTLRDPGVPEELMSRLYKSSGGNPLFLKEILSSMVSRGEMDLEGSHRDYTVPERIALPANLSQIIRRRLEERSPQTLELLEIASLTEDEFDLRLLQSVTDRSPMELASGLEPAVRTGLLTETDDADTGTPMYRFSYDAARQLLRDRVSRNLSAVYHRRIAEWLEQRMESGDDSLSGRIALHYLRAGEKTRAATVAYGAAMRALSHMAGRQAIRWLETYLASAPDTEPPRRRATALRELGRLHSSSGRMEKGHRLLVRALELADAELRPSILAELGENLYMQSRYPEAFRTFDRLLALPARPRQKVRALARKAFMEILEGCYGKAGRHLEAARETIDGMEEGPLRESMLALYHTRMGDLVSLSRSEGDAEDHYRRALAIYREHEDRLGEATVLNNMSELYSQSGDYVRDIEILHRVEEINRRHDDALGLAIASFNLAEAHAAIGQYRMAAEYYRRYMDLSRRIDNRLGLAYARLGLGRLEMHQGRYGPAVEYLGEAAGLFCELGSGVLETDARLDMARALMGSGDARRAESILEGSDPEGMRPDHRGKLLYLRGLLHLEAFRTGGGEGLLRRALEELREAVSEEGGAERIPEAARRWLSLVEAERMAGGEEAGRGARQRASASVRRMLEAVPSAESRSLLKEVPDVARLLG